MSNSNGLLTEDVHNSTTYCIIVQGTLSNEWSDRVAGMVIANTVGKRAGSQSSPTGFIRDQAELGGVLETPY